MTTKRDKEFYKSLILKSVSEELYQGFFVIARDYDEFALKAFSEEILSISNEHEEIIYLKAEENKSLLTEIRNNRKVEIIDEKPFLIHYGLKIPQEKPIILVIENFDHCNVLNEQYQFSKILNKEENLMNGIFIHPNSIILLSAKSGSKLDIKGAGFALWYAI